MTEGAFAVIVAPGTQRVLLVRRRDVPIWDLPGGGCEPGEDPRDCAIREAHEETGLLIVADRKVAEYHRPAAGDRQHVFVAHAVGGTEAGTGPETGALGWFQPRRLPLLMAPHRRAQIQDALARHDCIVRVVRDSALLLAVTRLIARRRSQPGRPRRRQ